MARQIVEITKEPEFFQLLKKKKKGTFSILYRSLWCSNCKKIMVKVDEWSKLDGDEIVYVVDSWNLPKSFASFGITSAPSLVKINGGRIRVDVEYPKVWSYFNAPKKA